MFSRRNAPVAAGDASLKRELGLFELTATGVGIILGAGIYVIIGRAAGLAGSAIWIPFLLGAFAATLTGLSYAELSSMFPKAAASFEFTRRAFGLRVAFVVGWLMLLSHVISSAAVALGFGGYLSSFIGIPIVPVAIGLIAVSSFVLVMGIKETVWIGVLFTVIEVGGLLLVIFVSARFLGTTSYMEMPEGIVGIFRATTLLFFAYLGFEQLANLGEEVRDAKRKVPMAILLAVGITSVFYVVVAISSVSALSWQELSRSDAPLADVVHAATGARASMVIGIIALFATANTVLFLLLTSTRTMYGMSNSNTLPRPLAIVHSRRKTPWVATLVAALIAAGFALLGDIAVVAQLSNFAVLVAFVMVNASLIWLRRTRPNMERGFKAPLTIRGIPVTAVLGIGFSLFMLANVASFALIVGLAVTAAGVLLPFVIPDFGKDLEGVSETHANPNIEATNVGN